MALPESTSQEGQKSKPSDQDDKDFDPSAEDIIDEIDDEATLEEEERLGSNNEVAVQEELDDLKKESEMPIEELLAYYERMRNEAQGNEDEDEEEDEDDDDDEENFDEGDRDGDDDDDKDIDRSGSSGHKNESTSYSSARQNQPDHQSSNNSKTSDNQEPGAQSSSYKQIRTYSNYRQQHVVDSSVNAYNTNISSTSFSVVGSTTEASQSRLSDQTAVDSQKNENHSDDQHPDAPRPMHSMTDYLLSGESCEMFTSLLDCDLEDSDDLDEDYSLSDDEERDWRRVIKVGSEYQAEVPEGLTEYGDLPPYENQDKLVWKCNSDLDEEKIVDFLKKGSQLSKRNDISVSPANVPKISYESMRIHRERMQDITSSTGSHIVEHNHENINTNDPQHIQLAHQSEPHPPSTTTELLQDAYMNRRRKRIRIDYELEQENAMDKMVNSNLSTGLAQTTTNSLTPKGVEDNHDSMSHDASKPELSTDDYFQDEEQLLYLLLQCNHNMDEALRRRKLDPFKYYLHEPMSLWSEDECLGFEHGLRSHGKNFRLIRDNAVQTRTHAEVVAFYYLWKKSERHDVYTNQYKLDRKRCLSHPGTTDYMDKFIEDYESALNASSSTTPVPATIEGSGLISSTNSEQVETQACNHNNNPPISSGLSSYSLMSQAANHHHHQQQDTIQFVDSATATAILQHQQHHNQPSHHLLNQSQHIQNTSMHQSIQHQQGLVQGPVATQASHGRMITGHNNPVSRNNNMPM